MRYRFIFLISFFLIAVFNIIAQTDYSEISGHVQTIDGHPAQFVNVQLKNTSFGSVTDVDGHFSFKAPKGKYVMSVSSITVRENEFPVTIISGVPNQFPHIVISEKAHELGEVVVTATRTPKRLADVPVSTTVITSQDIQKAGALSTLEALQDNLPGIVVTPNAMGNNLRIRGLNTRYMLILVDGERMVSEGAGGNINLDQIDVNSIRRIEVVNGAASVLYGSNAVGGVINIITREPYHSLEAGAKVIVETPNSYHLKADMGLKRKQLTARASAFSHSSAGFGSENESVYAARFNDLGANLKLDYRLIKQLEVGVAGRYFRHETFNRPGVLNVVHPLTHTLATNVHLTYTSDDKRNILRLSSAYEKYFDMQVFEKLNNSSEINNSASHLSTRLLNTFTINNNWVLVGGVEHNLETNFATTTLGASPTTKAINDINLFAQADFKPTTHLNLVAGARYTYHTQFGSAFTPKFTAMYSPGNFRIRANSGMAFRAPSIKEMYYDFDHQGMFWIHGNPNLKAELGWYNSLSGEYTQKRFNASVALYNNTISRKITQYSIVNADKLQELHYKNVNSATLRGVDVNASFSVWQLLLKANYSFCDAQDNDTRLQIDGNIRHSLTGSLTWDGKIWHSPFSLQLTGRYNSPRIYQTRSEDNQLTERRSKILSIWKLALVKPFRIGEHLVELTAKADNLLNFKDDSFVNPGRQYSVGLRYRFR